MSNVTTKAAAAASTPAAVAPPTPDFSGERSAALERELLAFSEAARVGHDACEQIATMSKLLLDQMKQPDFWRFPERMVTMVAVIWDRAAGAEAEIVSEVEEVGSSFFTQDRRAIQAAYLAARRG